jgi:hypothetical protein
VNDTAKTITLTLDSAYHSAADLVTAAKNVGADANWTFDGVATKNVTETTTALAPSTLGISACRAVIGFSEPASLDSSSAVTIDGVSALSKTVSDAQGTGTAVLFTTNRVGSVVINGTLTDIRGNNPSVTASVTIS